MKVRAKFITPIRPTPNIEDEPYDETRPGDVFHLVDRRNGYVRLSTNGLDSLTRGGWAPYQRNNVRNFEVVDA